MGGCWVTFDIAVRPRNRGCASFGGDTPEQRNATRSRIVDAALHRANKALRQYVWELAIHMVEVLLLHKDERHANTVSKRLAIVCRGRGPLCTDKVMPKDPLVRVVDVRPGGSSRIDGWNALRTMRVHIACDDAVVASMASTTVAEMRRMLWNSAVLVHTLHTYAYTQPDAVSRSNGCVRVVPENAVTKRKLFVSPTGKRFLDDTFENHRVLHGCIDGAVSLLSFRIHG